MSLDLNKIVTLLHIVDKASASPALHPLRNLALADLMEMSEDATEELQERAKKAAEATKVKAAASNEPSPAKDETSSGKVVRR